MNVMLTLLAITLASSLLIQFLLVLGFVRRLHESETQLLPDEFCPEGVVILCLRGSDPFLKNCIQGLVHQDYPNFRICFMLDHPQDPAFAVLKAQLAKYEFVKYEIHTLENPLGTCSLKCSSLVQAISGLAETTEFIALLDADTVPHASWLRELATGLQPNDVGAVSGNRWYMPERLSHGALIRYVWNAAAVVQMYWYRIAWGGTLAIKLDSIRRAGLLDRWRTALCEDTMLCQQLSTIGQRVEFIPSLMMVNREDCTVDSFVRWVKRQLLTARLYHALWSAVIAHGLSSAAFLVWGWISVVLLFLQRDWDRGCFVAFGMLLFQVGLSLMLPWMESAVSRIVRARGESTNWNAELTWWQFAWSVCVTQWVYTWALIGCLFMRRVEWRGIEYQVDGSWAIRMLEYRPLPQEVEQQMTKQSL